MCQEKQFVKMTEGTCPDARMLAFAGVVLCKPADVGGKRGREEKRASAMAKWREQTTRANCLAHARTLARVRPRKNFFPNLFAHRSPTKRISRLTFEQLVKENAKGNGEKAKEREGEEKRKSRFAPTSTTKFLETYRDRNYQPARSENRRRKLRRSRARLRSL